MEITFSWIKDGFGELIPNCTSNEMNANSVSPLACLLLDNGGCNYTESINWLEKGLEMARQVGEGVIDSSDWSRDAWAADLMVGGVKIYSMYDETCFEYVTLNSFRKVLLAWRNFIAKKPIDNEEEKIIL